MQPAPWTGGQASKAALILGSSLCCLVSKDHLPVENATRSQAALSEPRQLRGQEEGAVLSQLGSHGAGQRALPRGRSRRQRSLRLAGGRGRSVLWIRKLFENVPGSSLPLRIGDKRSLGASLSLRGAAEDGAGQTQLASVGGWETVALLRAAALPPRSISLSLSL